MTMNRRDVLMVGGPLMVGAGLMAKAGPANGAAPLSSVYDLTGSGLEPSSDKPQTSVLQALFNKAAAAGSRLILPKGNYVCGPLTLPSGLHLEGAGPDSRLIFAGGRRFVYSQKSRGVTLYNLSIEGAGIAFESNSNDGLVMFEGCENVHIERCRIVKSGLNGITLRASAGRIVLSDVSTAAGAGIFAIDSQGLEISGNKVTDCDNNGIQVWRSRKGHDGSLVLNNRVERIAAKAGGTGQNGNGINVFRAGSVSVSNNFISDCAFSAVRNNSGDNVQIVNNSCHRLGEVALYAEFAFEGAVINNNLVDEAHVGISITNYNDGGRLATATGNLIRNIKARKGVPGVGIGIEADTLATGNVIEEVEGVGIGLGWGEYMRDVTVNNNLIRNTLVGIGVTTYTKAGFALITTNMITGAKKGGIRPMDKHKPFGPDLSKTSPEAFLNLAVYGNVSL